MNGMKRAQAAMEYLMTYGWALLVIVLVLGALIYLGVLNPQGRMQDMCNLQIGFGCEVAGLTSDGDLLLKITNQQATQLSTIRLECKDSSGSYSEVVASKEIGETSYSGSKTNLNPGDSVILICEIDGFSDRNLGDFVNGDVKVTYDTSGIDKNIVGTYSAKVSVE